MRSLVELLRSLEQHIERSGDDGFCTCPCCGAGAWGWPEHKADCPVLEARALLGKCPHGYTKHACRED